MPARKGPRPATVIRDSARALKNYLFEKKGDIDEKYVYSQVSEIEVIATDMAANTGKQDPRLRKPARRTKKETP